jgi:hypothetical protein
VVTVPPESPLVPVVTVRPRGRCGRLSPRLLLGPPLSPLPNDFRPGCTATVRVHGVHVRCGQPVASRRFGESRLPCPAAPNQKRSCTASLRVWCVVSRGCEGSCGKGCRPAVRDRGTCGTYRYRIGIAARAARHPPRAASWRLTRGPPREALARSLAVRERCADSRDVRGARDVRTRGRSGAG